MEDICKLKEVYKALYNFEKSYTKDYGITINESMLICCLKNGEKKTANELCEFIGLSNSRVSKVINSVEDKGFITREIGKEDKRQMFFSLTQEGKRKVETMQNGEINFEGLISHFVELIKG